MQVNGLAHRIDVDAKGFPYIVNLQGEVYKGDK